MKLLLAALVVICAEGCVGYQLSTSSSTPLTAKPADCDFQVANLPPGGDGYEEIATLTPSKGRAVTPDSFKSTVRADVCKVGGDVVVTEINGRGEYVRGTVLRKRVAPAAAEPAAVAPAAAEPPPAAPPPAAP